MKEIVLVACSASKAAEKRPARDLYTGVWHRKCVALVEAWGHPWAILSAKHGLLLPETVVEPYNQTLAGPRRRLERQTWTALVISDITRRWGRPERVVLLAGNAYAEFLEMGLRDRGVEVVRPLKGLGIGKQLVELERLRGVAS